MKILFIAFNQSILPSTESLPFYVFCFTLCIALNESALEFLA